MIIAFFPLCLIFRADFFLEIMHSLGCLVCPVLASYIRSLSFTYAKLNPVASVREDAHARTMQDKDVRAEEMQRTSCRHWTSRHVDQN